MLESSMKRFSRNDGRNVDSSGGVTSSLHHSNAPSLIGEVILFECCVSTWHLPPDLANTKNFEGHVGNGCVGAAERG